LTYVARRWVWHQIGRSCDRLSRVTGTFSGYAREDIVHDTNGNRLRVERRTVANAVSPSQVDTYQLAPGTNRLTAITGASGSRSFAYDLRGNLTGETRSTGPAVAVTYDGRGRLTAYASAGASQTMTYNGADERVRVVTAPASGPVDTRVYVYDLDHRIIGEYGPGGNADVRAEYIWTLPEVGASGPMGADDGTGGYMPLAVAVGSGAAAALHWVHADHMGVPLVRLPRPVRQRRAAARRGPLLQPLPRLRPHNRPLHPGRPHRTGRRRESIRLCAGQSAAVYGPERGVGQSSYRCRHRVRH
jgi:YD repeat-containing protein